MRLIVFSAFIFVVLVMPVLALCGGCSLCCFFVFSSRRRHTRCALVTGVQTCALPIYGGPAAADARRLRRRRRSPPRSPTSPTTSWPAPRGEIGRASCRERVCQYV